MYLDPIRDYDRHDRERQERDDKLMRAQQYLAESLLAALRTNPRQPVSTPTWSQRYSPATDVVFDQLAGNDSDPHWVALLQLVSDAANGQNVQRRAMDWLNDRANAYADNFGDEVAERF